MLAYVVKAREPVDLLIIFTNLAVFFPQFWKKPHIKIKCNSGLQGKHCGTADWFDFCCFHTAADNWAARCWFCAIAGCFCLLILTCLELGSYNIAFASSVKWTSRTPWSLVHQAPLGGTGWLLLLHFPVVVLIFMRANTLENNLLQTGEKNEEKNETTTKKIPTSTFRCFVNLNDSAINAELLK